jgi:anti-sigma factor RsiW
MKLEARENMPHVDEGLLHAYLDGELAGAERDQVLAHLTECAACRSRLDEERALVARAVVCSGESPPTAAGAVAAVRRFHGALWRSCRGAMIVMLAVGWYAQAADRGRGEERGDAPERPPAPPGAVHHLARAPVGCAPRRMPGSSAGRPLPRPQSRPAARDQHTTR